MNRKKRKAWSNILKCHSACFLLVSPTKQDICTKLRKLKSGAKKVLLTHKKSLVKTGEGKAAPPPNDAVQKMLDVCTGTPSFQGCLGVDFMNEGMKIAYLWGLINIDKMKARAENANACMCTNMYRL